MENPNIEQTHILTCTVIVANGTSSSLVVINWTGGNSLSESSRVTISDQTNNGLQYTRMITFSPILSRDRGQYTCSVSVYGFSEADNSDTVMVIVSGKCVLSLLEENNLLSCICIIMINLCIFCNGFAGWFYHKTNYSVGRGKLWQIHYKNTFSS